MPLTRGVLCALLVPRQILALPGNEATQSKRNVFPEPEKKEERITMIIAIVLCSLVRPSDVFNKEIVRVYPLNLNCMRRSSRQPSFQKVLAK